MSTITYPDGSQLTSTALTDAQIQTAFQLATAQMLGLVASPITINFNLTTGSNQASVTAGIQFLYPGLFVVATGLPANTVISSVGNGVVTFNNQATATGIQAGTVTDPEVYSKVRIGWQQQGQPGPDINLDTAIVRCTPLDTEYSRLRDKVGELNDVTITYSDVFTRSWQTFWTFYGPNALDHARAVRSALITIQFVADALATNNLYVNPSIEEPRRVPELFQGQWWERVDLVAEFNEQITETYSVGTVGSVEVKVFTKDGQISDFTVTS